MPPERGMAVPILPAFRDCFRAPSVVLARRPIRLSYRSADEDVPALKLAYFVRPHVGGTYTVFTHLREGLRPAGVDVQWVTTDEAGPGIDCDMLKGGMVGDGASGGESKHAQRLIETLRRNRFDGVFVNVLANRLEMNIARYLPADMLRIMIVHNITPGTYAAARSLRGRDRATTWRRHRCPA